jgi:hypothetical protein
VLPAINLEFRRPASAGRPGETLRNNQSVHPHVIDPVSGSVVVFENLIFDLSGIALVALCVAGLMAPSRRPRRRAISDF